MNEVTIYVAYVDDEGVRVYPVRAEERDNCYVLERYIPSLHGGKIAKDAMQLCFTPIDALEKLWREIKRLRDYHDSGLSTETARLLAVERKIQELRKEELCQKQC